MTTPSQKLVVRDATILAPGSGPAVARGSALMGMAVAGMTWAEARDPVAVDPTQAFAGPLPLPTFGETTNEKLCALRRLEAQRLRERLSSIPLYSGRAAKDGPDYWHRFASTYSPAEAFEP